MNYELNYELVPVAEIEIDDRDSTLERIKQAVRFREGHEQLLERRYDNNWYYAFCHYVTGFILDNDRCPNRKPKDNDEGFPRMDGSEGIKVNRVMPWEFDEDMISVLE